MDFLKPFLLFLLMQSYKGKLVCHPKTERDAKYSNKEKYFSVFPLLNPREMQQRLDMIDYLEQNNFHYGLKYKACYILKSYPPYEMQEYELISINPHGQSLESRLPELKLLEYHQRAKIYLSIFQMIESLNTLQIILNAVAINFIKFSGEGWDRPYVDVLATGFFNNYPTSASPKLNRHEKKYLQPLESNKFINLTELGNLAGMFADLEYFCLNLSHPLDLLVIHTRIILVSENAYETFSKAPNQNPLYKDLIKYLHQKAEPRGDYKALSKILESHLDTFYF